MKEGGEERPKFCWKNFAKEMFFKIILAANLMPILTGMERFFVMRRWSNNFLLSNHQDAPKLSTHLKMMNYRQLSDCWV